MKQAVDYLEYYEAKNQIQIPDYREFYHQVGIFDTLAMFQQLLDSEKIALQNYFDSVRVSGNLTWLHQKQCADFVNYESFVDASIRGHKVIAICRYLIQHYQPAEIVDIVSNHRNILLRRREKIVLKSEQL